MSRINTNVSSLLSQRILGHQNKTLTTSLERLSTGLRINRGADDPAGLIASENLRSEKASITAAIGNAERAAARGRAASLHPRFLRGRVLAIPSPPR